VIKDGSHEDEGRRLGKWQKFEAEKERKSPADEEQAAHRMNAQVPRMQSGPAADSEHRTSDHRQRQRIAHEDDLERVVIGGQPLGNGVIHDKAEHADADHRNGRAVRLRLFRCPRNDGHAGAFA
jgi:hypothetical protein